MPIKQIRRGYSRVFKLMGLADQNKNEGEAQNAIQQAQKLIAQLGTLLPERGLR